SIKGCITARLQLCLLSMGLFFILEKLSEVAESPRLPDKMKVAFDQARKEKATFAALMYAVRALENMKEIVARDSVTLDDLEQLLARAQVGVDLKDGYLADVEEKGIVDADLYYPSRPYRFHRHYSRYSSSVCLDVKSGMSVLTREVILLLTPLSKLNEDECFDSGGDFVLEEIEACPTSDSIPPGIDDADFYHEGDIILLEKLLNDDPSPPLPPK
ncbi:hypothetical protein Tco_0545181, partial [Tanacetum coccineum]